MDDLIYIALVNDEFISAHKTVVGAYDSILDCISSEAVLDCPLDEAQKFFAARDCEQHDTIEVHIYERGERCVDVFTITETFLQI